MSQSFPDDEQRLLELLGYKIGFNALARITILKNENPLLKTVRFRVAAPQVGPEDLAPPWSPSGELTVNADLIERVFAFALAHEDSRTFFGGRQMIFFDVLDRKHEGFQSFILLFLSPDIL